MFCKSSRMQVYKGTLVEVYKWSQNVVTQHTESNPDYVNIVYSYVSRVASAYGNLFALQTICYIIL